MRGYAYDRRDVTGRGLANAYAQTLGTIFSAGGEKPYEVELFVAEVGDTAADDQIYRLTYDGQVADEHGFAVMGGAADEGGGRTSPSTTPRARTLADALPARRRRRSGTPRPVPGSIPADHLEVAVLDRTRTQPAQVPPDPGTPAARAARGRGPEDRRPRRRLTRSRRAPPADPAV